MRAVCLALPGSGEGEHAGLAAFDVQGKIFTTCLDKRRVREVGFAPEPDHAAALAEQDPMSPVHPRHRRGVVVDVAKVKSW